MIFGSKQLSGKTKGQHSFLANFLSLLQIHPVHPRRVLRDHRHGQLFPGGPVFGAAAERGRVFRLPGGLSEEAQGREKWHFQV